MCGEKLSNGEKTGELVERLMKKLVEGVKRSGLRWMCHVLRRGNYEPVKRAWDPKVGISCEGKEDKSFQGKIWQNFLILFNFSFIVKKKEQGKS